MVPLSDVLTCGKPASAMTDSDNVDRFRIMYDVKGRFKLHPIDAKEAKFKYCKVVKQAFIRKAIPHDGHTMDSLSTTTTQPSR